MIYNDFLLKKDDYYGNNRGENRYKRQKEGRQTDKNPSGENQEFLRLFQKIF